MKRRIIALLSSVTLLFGSVSAYAGFTDMPKDTNETRIVNILNKLGIMNGYEDGSFKPSAPITRTEFAVMLYKSIGYLNTSSADGNASTGLLGGFDWRKRFLGSDSDDKKLIYPEAEEKDESGVQISKGPWKDISEEYWAYSYLRTMNDMGIIQGYDDRTFRPENTVKCDEAIKIVLNLCGYDSYAKFLGGYPEGYRKIANDNKLYSGVSAAGDGMMSRMDAAALIYNSFKIKLAPDMYGDWKQDRNFLNDVVGVYTVEGTVTATDITSVYGSDKTCCENSAEIENISFIFDEEMIDIRDCIGMEIRAFLKKDKSDDSYSLLTYEETGRDEITVINNQDLIKFENNTFTYQRDEETVKTKRVTVKNGSPVIYNGKLIDEYSGETFANQGRGAVKIIKKRGFDFDIVVAENFTTGYTEVKNSKKRELTDALAKGDSIIKFDTDENNDKIIYSIFDSEKNRITFEEIGEGAINYYCSGNYLKLYYSKNTLSGTLTGKKEEDGKLYVTIGGKKYPVSDAYFAHSGDSIKLNIDVTATADIFGEIAWIADGGMSAEGYVYLIKQVLNEDDGGLLITYYDLDANKVTKQTTVDTVRFVNQKGDKIKASAEKIHEALDGYDGVIKIALDENEKITKIELPRNADSKEASALKLVLESNDQSASENYREKLRYLSGIRSFGGKAYINEVTKILNVPQDKNDLNYYGTSNYKTLKTESYLFKLYSFEADSPYVDIAVLSKSKNTNYFVADEIDTYFVLNRETALNGDDEPGVKLLVTNGETTKEFFASDDSQRGSVFDRAMNAFNEPAKMKISPGDFIHVAFDSVNNEVINARIVFDADGLNPAWCGADPADNITSWPPEKPHSNTVLGCIPGSTGFVNSKDYKTNPVGYTVGVSGSQKTPGNTANWQMWMYGFVYSFKKGLMEITTEKVVEGFDGTPDKTNYSCYFYDPNIRPAKYYIIHKNRNGGYTIEKGDSADVKSYTQVGKDCSRCVFDLAGGTMRAVWIFED